MIMDGAQLSTFKRKRIRRSVFYPRTKLFIWALV